MISKVSRCVCLRTETAVLAEIKVLVVVVACLALKCGKRNLIGFGINKGFLWSSSHDKTTRLHGSEAHTLGVWQLQ